MKVFISWSGERSKAVAEVLDEWLQCVIQAIDPWLSSKDIERGALWFTEISAKLAETSIGIICLTQDNKNKPWILFEAGALAKGLSSSRVCTFLIDLQPTDIDNPLAQFNHTTPDRTGVYELLRTINTSLGDKALNDKVLGKVFDTYWPQFEAEFKKAIDSNPCTEIPQPRSENNILLEVLSAIRNLERKSRERVIFDSEEISNNLSQSQLRPSPMVARNIIKSLLNNGAPDDIIKDVLIDVNVPEIFINKTLQKINKSINDNN
jgi:hypothetical protein